MKKFIPILVVCILVLSGLGAAAFTTNVSNKQATIAKNESTSVLFSSQPVQLEKDGFVEISVDGATTNLLVPNRPVLPIYVKTYQIPFGSTNIQVVCTPKDMGTLTLTNEIIPARIAPLSKMSERTEYVKDSSIYGSAEFYPSNWYSVDLGAGRNENDVEVTFVKVVCYPVRYSPLNNEVAYAGGFDIDVAYTEPMKQPKSLGASYDMVIIAPAKFQSALQPLIDHKNSKGVATQFKSVEDILAEYTGYDQPEQIKMFIKNEYDNSNITYVLLVGGLKSHIFAKDKDTRSAGWKAWWVPARYVSMPQDDDEGCLSDLYYGCLYNATGVFDSWDSNGDGVYAAWNAPGAAKDTFDMNPEVYVARLACTNEREVKVVVKKIITYESTGPEAKPWYKNFVGVGGKTFAFFEGKPDGEYLNDLAYNLTKHAIPDLTLTTCYSSNRDTGGRTPTPKDIEKSITEGAGFVDFEGHGNPYSWNTIWFDGVYPVNWTGGLNVFLFPRIRNGDMLPVVVVGGCHNALYNVSMIPAFLDRNRTRTDYFCYGVPLPVCFSWGLVVKTSGGAIASTGCTGYGFGNGGDPNTLSGALEMNFFWQIGYNNVTNLAKAHSQAISKFINENVIDQTGAFCITNWALFGDASLKLGGYSS
ncbi:MAG TPA: hypothetical protein DSN98_01035 [Thermoplasmata archaeon]|jgi:hypothetical protein|nr:MAG TPA: hypothetical protein DSN98_01035 [Thermoplasmata archaeon]